MFKIHIVGATNCHAYRDELDQYFRLRHRIYVGERGWHALERADGLEIDAFDTAEATHLLGITDAGVVVAGSRLVPSVKPHLMGEVFPTAVRGRASGIGAAVDWLANYGLVLAFPIMQAGIGLGWVMIVFAALCVIGIFFVYFFLPETKGHSVEELVRLFEGPVNRKEPGLPAMSR